MQCPQCQHLGRAGDKFCAQCGARQELQFRAKRISGEMQGAGQGAQFQLSVGFKAQDAEAYHRQAHSYHSRGDLEGAVRMFRQALQLEPDSAMHHRCLGFVYLAHEKYDDAAHELGESIRLRGEDHEALYLLIGKQLVPLVHGPDGIVEHLQHARAMLIPVLNFPFPPIRILDTAGLPPRGFALFIYGCLVASGGLEFPDEVATLTQYTTQAIKHHRDVLAPSADSS